jgi:hypothetical protein
MSRLDPFQIDVAPLHVTLDEANPLVHPPSSRIVRLDEEADLVLPSPLRRLLRRRRSRDVVVVAQCKARGFDEVSASDGGGEALCDALTAVRGGDEDSSNGAGAKGWTAGGDEADRDGSVGRRGRSRRGRRSVNPHRGSGEVFHEMFDGLLDVQLRRRFVIAKEADEEVCELLQHRTLDAGDVLDPLNGMARGENDGRRRGGGRSDAGQHPHRRLLLPRSRPEREEGVDEDLRTRNASKELRSRREGGKGEEVGDELGDEGESEVGERGGVDGRDNLALRPAEFAEHKSAGDKR